MHPYYIILITHFLDALVTLYALNNKPYVLYEANPIFRYAFTHGNYAFILAKTIILTIALLHLHYVITPTRSTMHFVGIIIFISVGIAGFASGCISWYLY